jgi:SOS-response transcriptional repressor LexA
MHELHESPPAVAPMGLTPKQRACLDAIQAHLEQTRTMPSVENLRVAMRAGSKAGVLRLLRQLEERGHISRLPHRARAIRLLHGTSCPHCDIGAGAGARGI